MNVVKLKAGKYLIGDPCYQFTGRHNDWIPFVSVNGLLEGDTQGTGYEQELAVFGTYFGDGTYLDNEDNEYPVDSGLIGAIYYVEGTEIPFGNYVYEFSKPFECFSDDGILHFGNVVIDTFNFTETEDEGVLFDEL